MSLFDRLFRRPQALVAPVDRRGAAIAAACAVCLTMTAAFEGLRTKPYKDVTGTPTVCYGDTEVEMRAYTADECGALLRKRMARDYAPRLVDCVPAFIRPENRNRFAALIDFSYNAGWSAACRSRMARSFNAGRWTEGCNGFEGYYVTSKGVRLRGLERRRIAEKGLCLKPVT